MTLQKNVKSRVFGFWKKRKKRILELWWCLWSDLVITGLGHFNRSCYLCTTVRQCSSSISVYMLWIATSFTHPNSWCHILFPLSDKKQK